jgi:hypothetical protein
MKVLPETRYRMMFTRFFRDLCAKFKGYNAENKTKVYGINMM